MITALTPTQAYHFIQSPSLHHLEPQLPSDYQKILAVIKSDTSETLYEVIETLKSRGYLSKSFDPPTLTSAGLKEIRDLLTNEWKEINGMLVNTKGEVKSLNGKPMNGGGKKEEMTVSGHSIPRMVCAAFLGKSIDEIIGVRWKDGNNKNNALVNLTPITLEEFPEIKINLDREEADDGQFKPHFLYLTILSGSCESLVKIGVSKWKTDLRFQQEINYIPIKSHHFQLANGIEARGWESLLKERVIPKSLKRIPSDAFIGGGKYECYDLSIYIPLLNYLKVRVMKKVE